MREADSVEPKHLSAKHVAQTTKHVPCRGAARECGERIQRVLSMERKGYLRSHSSRNAGNDPVVLL